MFKNSFQMQIEMLKVPSLLVEYGVGDLQAR